MNDEIWVPVSGRQEWGELFPRDMPTPLAQTWEWGEAKTAIGRQVVRYRLRMESGTAIQAESRRPGFLWAPGAPSGTVTQESARHVGSLADQLGRPVVVSPHFPLPGIRPLRHHPYLPGTVVLDLAIPLPELRKAFDKKWRNALSKAERSSLTLVDGSIDELLALQADLSARKGFRVPYTPAFVHALKGISEGKFGVRMATSGGQTLAAWADVIGGNTATYLIGATTDAGRASNASYLLAYDALSRLKEAGARFLDLGGAGPASDGGTHRFKAGMGGDLGVFPGSYCFGRGPRGALVHLAFELRSLAGSACPRPPRGS